MDGAFVPVGVMIVVRPGVDRGEAGCLTEREHKCCDEQ